MASMDRDFKPGVDKARNDSLKDASQRLKMNLDQVDNAMRFGSGKRVQTLSHSPDGSQGEILNSAMKIAAHVDSNYGFGFIDKMPQ